MNVAVKTADKPKVEHKTPQVIKKVGVIGAGQMGTGIAHVIALGGYSVALNDLKKETVDESVKTIERFLKRQAEKGIIAEDDVKPALEAHQLRAELRSLRRLRSDHRGRNRR